MLKKNSVDFNSPFYELSGLKAFFGGGVISDPRAEERGYSILIYCN
jgi:hypothetical protein